VTVRVLLFDDEEVARAGLASRLNRLPGLEVIASVGDEQQAGEALRRQEADVVLIDLHSQSGDGAGPAMCARLREMVAAPLVVLTSFMTPERWDQLEAAGVDGYLLKKIDSEALERKLVAVDSRYRARNRAPGTKEENVDG
jgi:DNA-binding NarL/FixJ family response regulator